MSEPKKCLSPMILKTSVKMRIFSILNSAEIDCSREKLCAFIRLETGLSPKVLDRIIDDMLLIDLITADGDVLRISSPSKTPTTPTVSPEL